MYYVSRYNGTKEGPFSEEVVLQRLQSGEYSKDTLVWCEGMVSWKSAWEHFQNSGLPREEASPGFLSPEMPPLPDAQPVAFYHINTPSGQKGPFTYNGLKSMLQRGELSGDSLVWKEGTDHWVKMQDVVAHCPSGGVAKGLADSVAEWVGTEKISNFDAKYFFGNIFKKHTESEVIDFFCAGGPNTTPRLDQIVATWPSPWVFTRVLILSLFLFFGFNWLSGEFNENLKTIPGLIFAGNFAVPFSFLVLFAELNIRRDVPWFVIMKVLMGGGLVSLIFTLIFFKQTEPKEAYWAGPIEESAKLLAVVFMARKSHLNGRILTGLLYGAAVGAGFAIFESAGYAYEHAIGVIVPSIIKIYEIVKTGNEVMLNNPEVMWNNLFMIIKEAIFNISSSRALLSPLGHIIYTAITAGALWRVMDEDGFSIDKLLKGRFLRIAVVPVILHMFWNSPLMESSENTLYLKYGLCGVVGWLLVLLLVNEGISQVRGQQGR